MENVIEKSFPFDAKLVNGKYDREYLADDFARFFRAFISSGVFMEQRTNLQVIANDDMTVTICKGEAIIDGYRYDLVQDARIQITPADGLLNRIDRISVTWSKEERKIRYTVREGEYASIPTAPECRRSAEYRDYVVADIYVEAGAISISQSAITDQRLNSDVCGMAMPFKDLDTKMIFDQLQAFYRETVEKNREWEESVRAEFMGWFELIRDQLSEDAAGNLLKMIEDLKESTEKKVGEVQKAIGTTDISGIGDGTLTGAICELNTGLGGIILSYADGNYYAQYGEDESTKKVLGEIRKEQLIAVLANSGLGLTLDSTPEQIYAALASKFPQELSMIMAGWIYSGVPAASTGSDSSRAIMTITDTPNAGWGYYTSPAFDITAFKTLQIVGAAYKFTQNSGEVYSPRIHLVGQTNGQVVSLYQHGGGQKVTENINKTINISGYSGKYQLRLGIYSYNDVYSWNNTAYIKLTKALLST